MRNLLVVPKLFLLVVYYLTFLFPRKKNQWLFGEANGFNNNSKYLFLEILEKHPEIKAYWIGNRKLTQKLKTYGLPAVSKYSLKGIWLCLTSKIYVVSWLTNDISFFLSGGSNVVNLWHGVGWKQCLWTDKKKITFDRGKGEYSIMHFLRRPSLYYKPKIVLSSSPFYTKKVFAPSFDVDEKVCVEANYPRCEFMLKSQESILAYLKRFNFKEEIKTIERFSKHNKVYLYAPTFRDTASDFIGLSGIDFDDLDSRMSESNSLFVIKFHPSTKYDKEKLNKYHNILLLDHKCDLYPLMPFTSAMISDYSSIAIDYLLLNKPIILFTFDYDVFMKTCRDFLVDFRESTKGFKTVFDYPSLVNSLNNSDAMIPQKTKTLFWDPKDNLIVKIKNL